MTSDHPTYRHLFTICPACHSLKAAQRPCGCRALRPPDAPRFPLLWRWVAFGLAGWGVVAGLWVVGTGLARLLGAW